MATLKQQAAESTFEPHNYGIHANHQIMFDETAEDLADLAVEFHHHYRPRNPNERFLVDTLIHNEWRLRRLRRAEAEIWESQSTLLLDVKCAVENESETEGDTAYISSGETFSAASGLFVRLQRVVDSCERNYHRALKELNRIQAAQPPEAQPTNPQPQHSTTSSATLGSFRQNCSPTVPSEAPPAERGARTRACSVHNRVNALRYTLFRGDFLDKAPFCQAL